MNSLIVILPSRTRFGLEGLVTFKRENEYDPETYEIAIPTDTSIGGASVRIGVFDKVKVEITVEKVSTLFLEEKKKEVENNSGAKKVRR